MTSDYDYRFLPISGLLFLVHYPGNRQGQSPGPADYAQRWIVR
jgi:hypothetical protein